MALSPMCEVISERSRVDGEELVIFKLRWMLHDPSIERASRPPHHFSMRQSLLVIGNPASASRGAGVEPRLETWTSHA